MASENLTGVSLTLMLAKRILYLALSMYIRVRHKSLKAMDLMSKGHIICAKLGFVWAYLLPFHSNLAALFLKDMLIVLHAVNMQIQLTRFSGVLFTRAAMLPFCAPLLGARDLPYCLSIREFVIQHPEAPAATYSRSCIGGGFALVRSHCDVLDPRPCQSQTRRMGNPRGKEYDYVYVAFKTYMGSVED